MAGSAGCADGGVVAGAGADAEPDSASGTDTDWAFEAVVAEAAAACLVAAVAWVARTRLADRVGGGS